MELTHLHVNELRDLIKMKREDPYRPRDESQIKCICSTDLFFEVETVRKNKTKPGILDALKARTCNLYAAAESGFVQIIDLDQYCLENGLFEVQEDFYRFEIWQPGVDLKGDPAHSARIVSLRAFDKSWGSRLCDSFQEE